MTNEELLRSKGYEVVLLQSSGNLYLWDVNNKKTVLIHVTKLHELIN